MRNSIFKSGLVKYIFGLFFADPLITKARYFLATFRHLEGLE